MEVEDDETLNRIEEVDETPHDAKAMEMQGGWANLQERELLASKRLNVKLEAMC